MEKNIQYLFSLLDSDQQKNLIIEMSNHFKMKPLSIRNNWFSHYKEIPKRNQSEVLTMLQRKIKIINLTPQL